MKRLCLLFQVGVMFAPSRGAGAVVAVGVMEGCGDTRLW